MTSTPRPSSLPLALAGFVGLAGQGLLFREHLRLYGGDELGIGIFLASWLLWIAAGARLHRGLPGGRRAFFFVLAFQPLAILIAAALIWQARAWAGLGPTEPFPPAALLPLTLLALAPMSLATGWLLPAGTRRLAATGPPDKAVGRAWAAEALGGAAGGAAVTLVLVLGVSPLAPFEGLRTRALPLPADAEVLETLETPYTSWTAARLGGGTALYGDGALRSHLVGDGDAAWRAAALLAQRPGARRAGILGFGAEALACRLLDGGLEEVVVVGRDPAWPALLRRHAPPALAACLDDPRLVFATGDRPPAGARWDLVWLAHRDPTTAAAARFLTREALVRAGDALEEDGVLGLEITVTENVLDGPALAYAAAVDATLASVFAEVEATAGEHLVFLASDGHVLTDPDALAARLDGGPGPGPLPGAGLSVGFEPARMATRRARLDATPAGPITASRPSAHLLHLLHEGRASGDPLVGLLATRGGLAPWLVLVLALGVLLVWGRAAHRGEDGVVAPTAMVAFGGAAAMGWQIVLLLTWQFRLGSLAVHFGVLSGLFMLGLWAGARGMTRKAGSGGHRLLAACTGALLAAGGLLLGLTLFDLDLLTGPVLLAAAAILGLAGGAVIPVAAGVLAAAGAAPGSAATRLSVADHLGATGAALLAGLALVPEVGFSGTVMVGMVGVAAAGGLAILAGLAPGPGRVPSSRITRGRRIRLLLLLAAAVSLHQAGRWSPADPSPAVAGFSIWEAAAEPFPHKVRRDGAGRWQRLRITSGAPRAPGYEGPVSLWLDLNRDGVIVGVKMGPHRETPSYVWGIEDWVEGLRGARARELHLRGEGPPGAVAVDAMTGATVTCRSLLASARAAAVAVETAQDVARTSQAIVPEEELPRSIRDATAGVEPLRPPPAPPAPPRLHRKDAKQTRHQRDVDRAALDTRIREGTLSDHEASHYLSVERR